MWKTGNKCECQPKVSKTEVSSPKYQLYWMLLMFGENLANLNESLARVTNNFTVTFSPSRPWNDKRYLHWPTMCPGSNLFKKNSNLLVLKVELVSTCFHYGRQNLCFCISCFFLSQKLELWDIPLFCNDNGGWENLYCELNPAKDITHGVINTFSFHNLSCFPMYINAQHPTFGNCMATSTFISCLHKVPNW